MISDHKSFGLPLREQQFTADTPVMVSVVMIAYNVERYIESAVESVLNQIVNFRVELVIGEDCSTDHTREIALKYEKNFPDIIRVLKHPKNIGLTPNCVVTHNACIGKYISLLDSDDYWTNTAKLQLQIDFLEKNLGFSASAHQADIVFDDLEGEDIVFGSNYDSVLLIKDMLQHRKFHTSSLVYRREYWIKSGGIPENILSNERAIYPMLSIYGKIMYWKESMCIYRRSSIGISSRITTKQLETDLNMIPWLKKLDPHFPYIRYRSFLHLTTYSYPSTVPFFSLLYHFCMFGILSFSYFPKNLGDLKYGLNEFLRKLKI
jgi:glycosyltransferase involved in cell wall biosynthesis